MLPRVVESLLGRDIVMLACGVYHTMALSGEGATIKRRGGGWLLTAITSVQLIRCQHFYDFLKA